MKRSLSPQVNCRTNEKFSFKTENKLGNGESCNVTLVGPGTGIKKRLWNNCLELRGGPHLSALTLDTWVEMEREGVVCLSQGYCCMEFVVCVEFFTFFSPPRVNLSSCIKGAKYEMMAAKSSG